MATAEARERILVVDDDPPVCELLAGILTEQGFEVDTAEDGAKAIELLDRKVYAICITDLNMPKVDGLGVLRHIQDSRAGTLGIVATGYSTIESAVDALRSGAFDYITKPFLIEEIRVAVARALEVRKLRAENLMLRRNLRRSFAPQNMIGAAPRMREVFEMITAVADSDSTVLILGESGTGKELVARTIHQESPRRDRLLVPVNCGALPENLLESELFGHVKGSFTGATATRQGRFQVADGGTIFLDEVGEMSPQLQVKLLRVLQEGQFELVGSTETVSVDVRVIAATNRDLEEMVEQKTFREDLYYRLHVIPIEIPPLRERIDDMMLLIDHFARRFCEEKGRQFLGFEDDALEELRHYPWPGNVRELENLVERCVILYPNVRVAAGRLPEKYRARKPAAAPAIAPGRFPDEGVDLNELVESYEAQLIAQALEKADGVKNRAAQLLNIKRTTLVEKMKKKGIV